MAHVSWQIYVWCPESPKIYVFLSDGSQVLQQPSRGVLFILWAQFRNANHALRIVYPRLLSQETPHLRTLRSIKFVHQFRPIKVDEESKAMNALHGLRIISVGLQF